MKVKLHREGTFTTANLKQGHKKCGPLDKHDYKFVCEIVIKQKHLDENAFVCDTNELNTLFMTLYRPTKEMNYPSCEEMAIEFVKLIRDAFVPKAEKVTVQIWPMGDRYVEASWER